LTDLTHGREQRAEGSDYCGITPAHDGQFAVACPHVPAGDGRIHSLAPFLHIDHVAETTDSCLVTSLLQKVFLNTTYIFKLQKSVSCKIKILVTNKTKQAKKH
jgi:hypothetical protein